MTPQIDERQLRKLLFFLLVFCYAYYFHPVLYDNATTRIALSCDLATMGTTRIDPWADFTEDKAFFRGHYYCDKAPGLSLLAVPIIRVAKVLGVGDFCGPRSFGFLQYCFSFILLGIPTAAAATLLFRALRSLSVGPSGAFMLAAAWGIGTNVFTYATHFYDHQLSALLTFGTLYFEWTRRNAGKEPSIPRLFLYGLALSLAAASEFPTALTSAIIGFYILFGLKEKRRFLWLCLGGVGPIAMVLAYNQASFGSPFTLGYFHEANQYFNREMSRGFGGVTYPRPDRFLKILFSPQRGLLWGTPFLFFAIPGFARLLRRDRALAWTVIAVTATKFLVNSSYYEVMGGYTPGPRFLVPAMPFLILAIGAWWAGAGRWARWVLSGLCLASIIIQSALNTFEPHVPLHFPSPLMSFNFPLIRLGYRPLSALTFVGIDSATAICLFAGFLLAVGAYVYYLAAPRKKLIVQTSVILLVATGFLSVYCAVGSATRPKEPYLTSFYLGIWLSQNGKLESAVRKFDDSLKLKPNSPFILSNLASTYTKMRRYREAADTYQRLTDMFPDYTRYRLSLAASEYLAGRFDACRKDLDKVLSVEPGNPAALALDAALRQKER